MHSNKVNSPINTPPSVPSEWNKQDAIIIGFPSHHDLWPGHLLRSAQKEVADLCNAISSSQTCYLMVANQASRSAAKKLINPNVDIIVFDFGDVWFRDISPIIIGSAPNEAKQALRFQHNGWGGKYCYQYDDTVAERLSEHFKLKSKSFPFVLEGGALEHNGSDAILTTRQCLLNKNRNDWTEAKAEQELKSAFSANKIYWLNQGLAFDHTDGHIDNIARFVRPDTVLIQTANGTTDPNALLYQQIESELIAQGLSCYKMPSPGRILDDDGEIMPASHLNYIITNKHIIFPHYLKNGRRDDNVIQQCCELLQQLFPTRVVLSLPSNALLSGGGSFHCISQHIPA